MCVVVCVCVCEEALLFVSVVVFIPITRSLVDDDTERLVGDVEIAGGVGLQDEIVDERVHRIVVGLELAYKK